MANTFSKEELVLWNEILQNFSDKLSLINNVRTLNLDPGQLQRSGDVTWIPQPSTMLAYDGLDQSSNFKDQTDRSVPLVMSPISSVPFYFNKDQLRDRTLFQSRMDQAFHAQASKINRAILTAITTYGSIVIKKTTAAGSYDDVASCDTAFNINGVPAMNRCLALNSTDYNAMASNLAVATRSFGNSTSERAYREGYVGNVAGFETYKLDYSNSIAAAGGGGSLTVDTRVGATNFYVPKSTSTAATGEVSNVDNRFDTLTISSTTGVVAGDCFTVAGIYGVHPITKVNTGSLKTFRVVSVTDSTNIVITPPMITGQGATAAEMQHQNCVATSTASNAAIVFLNTVAKLANPFWHKDSIVLAPSTIPVDTGLGEFVQQSRIPGTPLSATFEKQIDIATGQIKYRIDTHFGVLNANPEMNGIMLFSQS